jgi:hypothetical protein
VQLLLGKYVLGESQSNYLRITRSGAALVVIPSGRKAIEKLLDDHLAAVRPRRMEITAVKELYATGFAPQVHRLSHFTESDSL